MFQQLYENPLLTIFAALLALVPTIIWGYYFYKKDPEPKKYAIITFFGGVLSVIPILAYQASWQHIPAINIHYYIPQLLSEPGIYTVAFFLGVSVVVAFLSFLVSVLVTSLLAILTWTHGILRNIWRGVIEEQANFVVTGFLIAIFGLLILYSGYSRTEILIITVSLAVLEEFVKHIIVRFTDDNRIKSIDDAIEYSILVGLGFAFAENIFYFLSAYGSSAFWQIFIFRSILSVFAHIFFSGIFGYFYGIAHFGTVIYQEEEMEKRHWLSHRVIKFFHKIFHMKATTIFHEEKMMEGLVIAAILHSIFNFLLQLNKIVIVVPFLFGGFFLLSYLFEKKEDHKKYGRLSKQRLTLKKPVEDQL
ncbi:MAG TPA: PrsW family intramembrane metalloprotease [Candidatus Peregrinibacteria bacterium]|nr:PrsW family intramembrane metalloprotease [Candidatus Peregrinibacteria bacterium]